MLGGSAHYKSMKLDGMRRASRILKGTYRHVLAAEASPLTRSSQKGLWAAEMLDHLGIDAKILGEPSRERPGVFVGNHISYIDLPLLLAAAPDLSFVAKQEIAAWPIFGRGARVLETVFVQRNSAESRGLAMASLRAGIAARKGIVVFPSGTTSLDESSPWKFGAFRLAFETQAPLQVFRITYAPLRAVAYIDKDFFPVHLARACSSGRIAATLEFAEPFYVKDPEIECAKWREWTRPLPLITRAQLK